MKINIVSGATYFPEKVSQNKPAEVPDSAGGATSGSPRFEDVLRGRLSPEETAAIKAIFGQLAAGETGENGEDDFSIAGKLGAIPRGRFVDIKI